MTLEEIEATLRDENSRLKKLVADLSLDKDALQSVIRKNGWSSQS
jgi:putative transposase